MLLGTVTTKDAASGSWVIREGGLSAKGIALGGVAGLVWGRVIKLERRVTICVQLEIGLDEG